MSDWDDDISEPNDQTTHLSISLTSDMSSQQFGSASPSALSVTDDKKKGLSEDSRRDRGETVEEVNIDPVDFVDPVALESFLPLLEALDIPGLKLINGSYHLCGAVPEDAARKLSEYARRVNKFTLCKTAPEATIDTATWFRVLELRSRFSQSCATFFPSLTEVCINGADSSLDQIFLLLSPSLESVDVYNVPHTRSDTLLAFLDTVAEVVPGLSHLGVDSSLAFHDLQETYIRFYVLRSLRISVSEDSNLSYDTLLQLSRLSSLEVLILDASAVYYYAREDSRPPLSPKEPNTSIVEFGDPSAPSTCAPSPVHWTVSPSPRPATLWGFPSNPSFPPSRTPSPTPSIPSIEADVPTNLQQPAVPELSDDIAPLQNQSSNFQNLTKLHVKGQLKLMVELVQMITATMVIDIALTESQAVPLPAVSDQRPASKGKKTKKTIKVTPFVQDPYVGSFEYILEIILSAWGHSLKSVYFALADTAATNPSTISSALFKRLVSIAPLERLEISGYTLDANFRDALHMLTALPVDHQSKLKVIHLPINAGDKGISFNRLRTIFECCPSLVSFQCGFKHLSNIPALPSDAVTFGLRELVAGNPKAYGDRRRLATAAQYLDALFPHLSVMKTEADCNAGEWEEIYDLVRMCQSSRSYHNHK